MAQLDDLQARLDGILSGQGTGAPASAPATLGAAPQRRFSEFFGPDIERAVELANQLSALVDQRGGEAGLADALDEIDRLIDDERPGLIQHAVKLFLTHNPTARAALRFRPLEQRQPNRARAAVPAILGEPECGTIQPEDQLDFWREDPLLNEHHEHWHAVYAILSGAASLRHGELFAYMHEQMLARYDAERLAVGLPRVEAFDDYTQPIPQGYDPGQLALWDGKKWYSLRARPAGATLNDLPHVKLVNLEQFYQRIMGAIERGTFVVGQRSIPVEINSLGNTEQANTLSVDPRWATYGPHHNLGHVHFAYFDGDVDQAPGVMADSSTAMRDPLFFRWHKHVDSIFQSWQNRLAPYDFADGPQVKLRKGAECEQGASSIDIILCRADGLPAQFDGEQLGQAAFGYSTDPAGDAWECDFSAAMVALPDGTTIATTCELTTEMLQRTIEVGAGRGDDGGSTTTINYLAHDDFAYFIRVQNLLNEPQLVTLRIFLAPEAEVADRTSWIELDRFAYHLGAAERAVIFRPAERSSVVRQPALKPATLSSGEASTQLRNAQDWCDCGWPYTLLLPRGTAQGMRFRLFVMCSSGDDLTMIDHSEQCTSISYCGLKDQQYPDRKEMGYPFNRPFASGIAATIAQHDAMASRTITIRLRPTAPA